MNPQEEANQVRAIVHARRLGDYDLAALRKMLSVLQMYKASEQPQMAHGIAESVENEIILRQRQNHHEENLEEIGEIRKAQIAASIESESKSHERHKEALRQNLELHAQTQKVAWIAIGIAVIAIAASVLIAWIQGRDKSSSGIANGETPSGQQIAK
jgi:hypothetical protein